MTNEIQSLSPPRISEKTHPKTNFFDSQTVSNHIHATFGPMLVAGLGVEF